eukprot:scaffold63095_cov53-Phaeocystis_antarctica.AAC.1
MLSQKRTVGRMSRVSVMKNGTMARRQTVVVAALEAATYSASAEPSGVSERRPARHPMGAPAK